MRLRAGLVRPYIVTRVACKRSMSADMAPLTGLRCNVQGPVLHDHLVQLRHLCAPHQPLTLGFPFGKGVCW